MYRRTNLTWSAGFRSQILLGDSFQARFWGLRTRGAGGFIVWAHSIHTFGVSGPIWVLEVDRLGVVLVVTLVVPRRLYRRAEPGLIIELTCDGPVPAVGDRLAVLPSSDDGRNTHSLCDTDWQPR